MRGPFYRRAKSKSTRTGHRATHPDGREECLTQSVAMRYTFRFEAEHLLARAGFEIEVLFHAEAGQHELHAVVSRLPAGQREVVQLEISSARHAMSERGTEAYFEGSTRIEGNENGTE